MVNNPFKPNRLTESQELLRTVQNESLGIYMAKEPKNADQWRDQDYWQILSHLKHEIEEIERSTTLDRKYHNTLDCIGQASILAAHLLLKIKEGFIREPGTPEKNALKNFKPKLFKLLPELKNLTEEELDELLDE